MVSEEVSRQFHEIVGQPDMQEVAQQGHKTAFEHRQVSNMFHDMLHRADDRIHTIDHLLDSNDDFAHPKVDMALHADRMDAANDLDDLYHATHGARASYTNGDCQICGKRLHAHMASKGCPARSGNSFCPHNTDDFTDYQEHF